MHNNTAIYDSLFTEKFPPKAMQTLLGYLNPEDLRAVTNLPASNVYKELGITWERIEEALKYPIDPEKSHLRNYTNFVRDLKVRTDKYPKDQVPNDIQQILDLAMEKAPSVAQVQKLQKFIKARDTLVVWKKMVDLTTCDLNFSGVFESADAAIEQAKKLAAWSSENREALNTLKELDLSDLQLTFVPEELCFLSNLQILDISSNQLKSIPKELRFLSNLEKLNIGSNQLESIPKELCLLSNLKILDISQNQLKSIPEELGSLPELRMFYLNQNQLNAIPKELGSLSKLMLLNISQNQLESIPEELGSLSKLMLLYISNNQLELIPKELGSLSNLNVLDISNNQLESIPKELCFLINLVKLDISHNQLESVPNELCSRRCLLKLNISHNKLKSLPIEWLKLQKRLEPFYLHMDDALSIKCIDDKK